MGMYDIVKVGDTAYAQVKVWDNLMYGYKVGDTVPYIGLDDYSVKLQEFDLWVNVNFNEIQSIDAYPRSKNKIDKWGREYKEDAISPVQEAMKEAGYE